MTAKLLHILNPLSKGRLPGDVPLEDQTATAVGEGRLFVKMRDNHEEGRIRANLDSLLDTRLCTILGNDHLAIHTVEHLLSSLEGMGVDNVRIELRGGNEVPILDGSSRVWIEAIQSAGIVEAKDMSGLTQPRRVKRLKHEVHVQDGDAFIKAFPSEELKFSYEIDFPQLPVVGKQVFHWAPSTGPSYQECIGPARTFGILEQFDHLRERGLIKGGSLDNALVCSMKSGWVNPPLRFPDEPCRHKLLDLIGDLALCSSGGHFGIPVSHILAYKGSHSLHCKFGKAVLEASVWTS